MSVKNEIKLPLRTVKVPLSEEEEEAFKTLLNQTWQKKGGFLRLAILKALEQQNLLPTEGKK